MENQGDFKETFDVFVYAVGLENGPGIEIGSETVSLDVGASETLFFIWDTTDVPPGSYWVIAEAVLPKDVEPEDNIRRALVGGIYPRNIPKETNMLELLTSWGPIIVMMVGFAVSPIVIFEILMSQELRLPRYFSKRRQHNTTK